MFFRTSARLPSSGQAQNPEQNNISIWAVSIGVQTAEIRKGRILAGLRDMWRVLLEILPLQESEEKHWKS